MLGGMFRGGGGGGGGVNIPIQFTYAQAMAALAQLGTGVTNLNNQVAALQGRMRGGVGGGTAGQVASGVGAFFLLRRAAATTFNVFKEGVMESAKLEQALNRLQSVSGATDDEMKKLSKSASKISGELGPIDILDVVHNMEALNRVTGTSIPNIQKFIQPFSAFTNAMVLVSGNQATPEMTAGILQRMIGSFGGLHDESTIKKVIEATYKAVAAYSPEDPERLIRGIQVAAPTLRAINLPIDQLISLAAFRTAMPTSGLRGSGPDLASLVTQAMTPMARLEKAGKKQRPRLESAMEELGVIRNGRPSIIDPATGNPDILRFFSSLSAGVQHLAATTPKQDFYPKLLSLFSDAFPEKIGRRIALLFADPENLKGFAEVISKIEHTQGLAEATKVMESGSLGAFSKLSSNLENLLIKVFDDPNKGLGKLASGGAWFAAKMTNEAEESDTVRRSMSGAFLSVMATLVSAIGGYLLSNLAGFLVKRGGFFASSMAGRAMVGGVDVVAGTMFGLAKLNIWVTIISGIILAAALAYRHSPLFKNAVDFVAKPILNWFEQIKNTVLDKVQDIFPPPEKAGNKFVGPKQPWFDRTQGKVKSGLSTLADVIKSGGIGSWIANATMAGPNTKGVMGLLGDYINNSPALRSKNLSKSKYGIDLYPPGEGSYPGSPFEKFKAFIKSPIEESKRIWSETKMFWSGLWTESINWLKNIYNAIVQTYNRMDTIIQDYLNGVGPGIGAAVNSYRNPPPTVAPPKTSTPPAANVPDYGFGKDKGTTKRQRQNEALTGRALIREFTKYLADDLSLDARAASPSRAQATTTVPAHQR